jgi:hypothetical protein
MLRAPAVAAAGHKRRIAGPNPRIAEPLGPKAADNCDVTIPRQSRNALMVLVAMRSLARFAGNVRTKTTADFRPTRRV